MKAIAYPRVSARQQDASNQRLAILEYAQLAIREYAQEDDVHIDDFIEATASGQAFAKRRRQDELTSVLQPGDRLVFSELSPARPVAGSGHRRPRVAGTLSCTVRGILAEGSRRRGGGDARPGTWSIAIRTCTRRTAAEVTAHSGRTMLHGRKRR